MWKIIFSFLRILQLITRMSGLFAVQPAVNWGFSFSHILVSVSGQLFFVSNMYECLPVCIYMQHMNVVILEDKSLLFLGTRVTNSCEQFACWEPNLSPLEEQPALNHWAISPPQLFFHLSHSDQGKIWFNFGGRWCMPLCAYLCFACSPHLPDTHKGHEPPSGWEELNLGPLRAVSALDHWAMSPAPIFFFFVKDRF